MSRVAILLLLGLASVQEPSDAQLKGWVEKLGAMYEADRAEARKQLASAGAAAEKRLVEGLSHADHKVRRGCLELLALFPAPSGVEAASALFRSKQEDRGVQVAAFAYLRQHGARAEDLLIEALDHQDEAVRLGAVETLSSIPSTKALPRAAALFDRETVKPIKDRIFALFKAAGEPARPHLVKMLGNPDVAVRQESLVSLIAMKTPPEELIDPVTKLLKLEVTPQILADAFDLFARAGPKAIPNLLEGLRSPSQQVREKALDAVKQEKTEAAFEGVAELYPKESADSVREKARAYLIDQGLKSEPVFLKAFDSALPKVRMEAIDALGKIKSEKVYDRVSALYRSEKEIDVRRACFSYLVSLGARAEGDLIAAIKDEDANIRRDAIRALGRMGSEKAIGPLSELLKDDKSPFRGEAVDALAIIGAKAVDFLREEAKAKRVRESDAHDVAFLTDQVAVERILDSMITADPSGYATTGTWPGQFQDLAKLGRDRVLPVLWKVAGDPEYTIRFREPAPVTNYMTYLQCLAILAIGELGDAPSLKKLQTLAYPPGDNRHREQLVAMHRLGDKAPLETFVANELKEARAVLGGDDRASAYGMFFNVALLQARIGSKDAALKIYQELVAAIEKEPPPMPYMDLPSVHYNIACLHATAGRKADAVRALARAVELGWKDFAWILKDKELDSIREEEGYKKLLPP